MQNLRRWIYLGSKGYATLLLIGRVIKRLISPFQLYIINDMKTYMRPFHLDFLEFFVTAPSTLCTGPEYAIRITTKDRVHGFLGQAQLGYGLPRQFVPVSWVC